MMFESIFRSGIDNLKFALNLDDSVPEYIMDELKSEQDDPKKKNSSNEVPMFSKIRTMSEPKMAYDASKQKQFLFNNVVGYDDLKKLFSKCLSIEDSCNILLSGPPASAKTMFLMSIQEEVSNACFIDAANASGTGLVDYLFEHPETRIICIDELDKLKKNDQNALLNLLETGILCSTKVRKTRSIRMESVKVFATSNTVDKLIAPLKSRFLELKLPEYTWESFLGITQDLLLNRYGLEEIFSEKIAHVVWLQLKTRDIRDVLTIAKVAKSSEDIEFIATILQKYKKVTEKTSGKT
jgi:holliday junction DNA helicase RuvB